MSTANKCIRFVRRLQICAQWQLRVSVVKSSARDWCSGMAEGTACVLKGAFIVAFGLIVSPILYVWHYSLGIVFHALTLSDSETEKLARSMSKDLNAKGGAQP